jgi:tetratricopeptide (TPR) repeat protein
MHKVEELEQKWFRYRFKKTVSPIFKVSLAAVFVSGSYYLYKTDGVALFGTPISERMTAVLGVSMDAEDPNLDMTTFSVADQKNVDKNQSSEKKVTKVEEAKVLKEMALEPIIPVIDLAKEERISDTPTRKVPQDTHLVRAKPNGYLTAKELAAVTKPQKVHSVPRTPHQTKKMKFTSTSTNYLDIMKDKFVKSKNPREAVLLAKAYYKEGKYIDAEKWSLTANKLNNSLEESWLIFAKSKVKLGKREEAIKILASYHKRSSSIEAKKLIGQIKTGKI